MEEDRRGGPAVERDRAGEVGEARPRRVVVADRLSPAGLEILRSEPGLDVVDASGRSREELAEVLADADAVIVRSPTTVDEELLGAAPNLTVVGRAGVGVDNIDLEAATRHGVAVMNAPGGNTRSTAELAFGLLLAAGRRIPEADRSVRAGRWERSRLRGVQLHGKTLGVVGVGRIGGAVATRARAFGLEVVGHDPYLSEGRAEELGVELVELPELLRRSDFVTLHAPLTEETRGLVGAEALAAMKDDALLVNAARGGLVDERALAEALRSGEIGGAALDVYREEPLPEDHPLREAPDLVLTPHLGSATGDARREVASEIATYVRDALLSGDLGPALNAPRVDAEGAEPVLDLAWRLGLLLSRLSDGSARRVELRYLGPHEGILRAAASSAMEGYLGLFVDQPLNRVNALVVAGERGVEVARGRSAGAADYPHYLELTAEWDGERLAVGGALLGGSHPRIVRIRDFHVDVVPRGALLVLRNRDVPGVIGEVGTRLGDAGLNIAEYHQARRDAGGDALAAVTLDAVAPGGVVEEIRALPEVRGVRQVDFAR